jgi:hypothetical protein
MYTDGRCHRRHKGLCAWMVRSVPNRPGWGGGWGRNQRTDVGRSSPNTFAPLSDFPFQPQQSAQNIAQKAEFLNHVRSQPAFAVKAGVAEFLAGDFASECCDLLGQ